MKFKNLLDTIFGTKTLDAEEARELYDAATKQAIENQLAEIEQQEEPQIMAVDENGQDIPTPSSDNDIAALVFIISRDGESKVRMQWDGEDEEVANALAALLYTVNTGGLTKSCSECLRLVARKEPSARPFIRDVFENWNEYAGENKPVIKPSEVFPQLAAEAIGLHKGGDEE